MLLYVGTGEPVNTLFARVPQERFKPSFDRMHMAELGLPPEPALLPVDLSAVAELAGLVPVAEDASLAVASAAAPVISAKSVAPGTGSGSGAGTGSGSGQTGAQQAAGWAQFLVEIGKAIGDLFGGTNTMVRVPADIEFFNPDGMQWASNPQAQADFVQRQRMTANYAPSYVSKYSLRNWGEGSGAWSSLVQLDTPQKRKMSYFNNKTDDVGLNPIYVAALKWGGSAAARNWDERGILPGGSNMTPAQLIALQAVGGGSGAGTGSGSGSAPNPVPTFATQGAGFGPWLLLVALAAAVWYFLSPKSFKAATGGLMKAGRKATRTTRSGDASPKASPKRGKRAKVLATRPKELAPKATPAPVKKATKGKRPVSAKTLAILAKGRAKRAANLARKNR